MAELTPKEQLGKQLFTRNKSGTKLTTEGRTFLPHARRLMDDWRAARASLSRTAEAPKRLSIGGEYTLSTALLVNWLVALKSDDPQLSVRTDVDSAQRLLDRVQAESLDVVTLYSPLRRAKLRTRLVLQEELVCITTHSDRRRPTVADYVYVDWGPDFSAQHASGTQSGFNFHRSRTLGTPVPIENGRFGLLPHQSRKALSARQTAPPRAEDAQIFLFDLRGVSVRRQFVAGRLGD